MSRTLEIDVFRGLNILEMENTESCNHPFFDHAEYQHMQMNYADTIFPCFSFISGMLLRKEKVIPIRKSLQLVGLGMVFNSIPSLIEGEKFRPLGVLQRHGLSSIILNNIVSPKTRNSIYFPISLVSIWCFISILLAKNKKKPFNNEEFTAQQRIDCIFFKGRTYHENFDPEGLLGALMTTITIWSGSWFMQQNFNNLQTFLFGSCFLSSGLILSKISPNYFPISKPLWTPAFILTSNGWSILKYLLVKVSIPYLPKCITTMLSVVGKHSMEVYFLGELLLLLSKYEFQKGKSLWTMLESWLLHIFPNKSAFSLTILTVAFDAALVGFALVCNSYKWKIRLF